MNNPFIYFLFYTLNSDSYTLSMTSKEYKNKYAGYININNIEYISHVHIGDLVVKYYDEEDGSSYEQCKPTKIFYIRTVSKKYYVCPESEFEKFIKENDQEDNYIS